MQVQHAAVAGASMGALIGCTICLVVGVSLTDALYRISILAVSGAWMGVILVWLNDLLTPEEQEKLLPGQQVHRP